MPVDFLTESQQACYGRFPGDPAPSQLARFFHLDDADRALIAIHRGGHNRLGFAVQLCTVRFLGTFLSNLAEVPNTVIRSLAAQLAIPDWSCLAAYSDQTRQDHAEELREHLGYLDFHAQPGHFRLVRWLYARAWLTAERPSMLFDLVTARLLERKILLPGVTTLTRLIASVRDRATNRLCHAMCRLLDAGHRQRLERLLTTGGGSRQSGFDRLRHAPTYLSAPGLVRALDRVREIRQIGSGGLDLSHLPANRVAQLARMAMSAPSQYIARMADHRRAAALLAFTIYLEASAQDDAIDLLEQLIDALLGRAERRGGKERLRNLKQFDAAALDLRQACLIILDWTRQDGDIRRGVLRQISAERLQAAADIVASQANPSGGHYFGQLRSRYITVRRFLPTLLDTISFQATEAGKPVEAAIAFLRTLESLKKPTMARAPLEVVNPAWRAAVLDSDGKADRRAYTFCVLERLRDALDHREVYVHPSRRWGDPRAKLLQGGSWDDLRVQVCRTLDLDTRPEPVMDALGQRLEQAYQRTAKAWPDNAAVRIEQHNGQDTLVMSPLDKLAEPASLAEIRERTGAMMPRVDLPEILLEVHAHTGFLGQFEHVSDSGSRASGLELSICAVLVAEACNVGLEPLIRRDTPSLTRARLTWVRQNHVRAETLARANACLVNAQSRIPLARVWGGGEVASADGLRFVTPVRTLHAGPNPKYFDVRRGITYYNFASDQFTGFHGIVIPGTLRDSLFILEGLLENQTGLKPVEVMSDTAGYSDVVFGLFWLLGYQFSPRLADIGEARFWRVSKTADYGVLNGLARHQVREVVIRDNWDDVLRVAGSLKMGTVSASELMRTLRQSGRPSAVGAAVAEIGRIAKTLYLLDYVHDDNYRRRILTQLNRGEGRHGLARAIFHGQRGEVRQRYREGQEDQLGALGLVLNAIVLWNTRYLDAAVDQLRSQGVEIEQADLSRLSPLIHGHINLLGRYTFELADEIAKGRMRPLRDPAADAADFDEMVAG